MHDNTHFYQHLPAVRHIAEITQESAYVDVPTDWLIALTDVQGSTQAIQAGRYKEVNGIASASICALLNAFSELDVPFVFGGDGATLLLPPQAYERARGVLIATQRLAREAFELSLRVGIVPVADVLAAGYRVRVAKLHYSDNFQQAILTGGGIAYADKLLKASHSASRYVIVDDNAPHEADFTGYECRWSEIPSQSDETISLMVTALGNDQTTHFSVYREVLAEIERVYGDFSQRNPLSFSTMRPALSPTKYSIETRIRQGTASFLARLRLMAWSVGGWLLWQYKEKIWEKYKRVVIEATDREKFDDTLRMLISGTATQRERLISYLEAQHTRGKLAYGVHVSTHTLMTCLVFDRFGKQVHFVDGGDGGYALASRGLKAQLNKITPQKG